MSMKQKTWARLSALLLCTAMAAACLPSAAFAADAGPVSYAAAAPAGQPEPGGYTVASDRLSGTSSSGPMSDGDVSSYFRIPALATLDNGWIVAVSDARWTNTNDSPNNLDTIVSVSKDGGETWEWEIVNYFADYAPIQDPTYWTQSSVSKSASASFIDPALVVDGSGKLWMLVDVQPPYINGGKIGTGFDSRGRMQVGYIPVSGGYTMDNKNDSNLHGYTYDYYVDINNPAAGAERTVDMTSLDREAGVSVTLWPIRAAADDADTGYYADAFFNTYYDYGTGGGFRPVLARQHESDCYIHNNLFYTQSDWKVFPTAFIMLRSAEVRGDGLVWSDPYLLNSQIKAENESFIGVCPGRGVAVTVNGKERLIFPVYDSVTGAKASVIYSDDGGETWNRSGRVPNGQADSSTESQIVQLPDGTLRMYSRNGNAYISYADSTDGGMTWSAGRLDNGLAYCSGCMVSFINVDGCLVDPDNNVYENIILASYPKESYRSSGVIRIGSVDAQTNAVTWLNSDAVRFTGRYNYSCLTQLWDGKGGFAVLYEQDDTMTNPNKGVMAMRFFKLTAEDLLGQGWQLVEPAFVRADNSLLDVTEGESKAIAFEYSPAEAEVSWTSSDESVVTVAGGVVTGVGAGKAVVTVSVTAGSVTRKASVNVLVQGADGPLVLPDEFRSGLTSATVPGTTSYVLDTDGVDDNVYIIYASINNNSPDSRVMHNAYTVTDRCTASWVEQYTVMNANSHSASNGRWTATDDLWYIMEQENGACFIRGVTGGEYLTAAASGTQLALSSEGVEFTITHQGNGVYYVQNGGNYLAYVSSGSWRMQPDPFEIRLYGEYTTPAVTTYTVTADGLRTLIRALDQYEAIYADVLGLAGEYDNEADALAAQARIDEASRTLYAQYRTGNTVRYTVTYEVEGELWGVQSYYAGNTIVPITNPVRAGYVFKGWTGMPADRIMPAHDLALVAAFQPAGSSSGSTPSGSTPSGSTPSGSTPSDPTPSQPSGGESDDPGTSPDSLPFRDVGADAWYAGSVAFVYEKGYMKGVSSVEFAPGTVLNRGMMAMILYNVAENPGFDAASAFADANGKYYAEAVAWGTANGVLKGVSNTAFGGEDDLTREQMAVMLYRYAQFRELSVAAAPAVLSGFRDSGLISGWAEEAMAWAVDSGLLQGRGNSTLAPAEGMTRAEATVVLERFAKRFLA